MADPKCIYIAGPLGFSEIGRAGQTEIVRLLGNAGFVPVDPFILAPVEEIGRIAALPSLNEQRDAWRLLAPVIAETNTRAIDACAGVLAILDGPDVDSGTAAEIGYAFARGKTIVGYRGDFRLATDNLGSTVNLQVEYFIAASGGHIVATIGDVPATLRHAFRAKNAAAPP